MTGGGAAGGSIDVSVDFNVDVSPSGGGVVELDGSNSDSYPFTYRANRGRYVHIEAMPADGYRFAYWIGDLTGSENPVDVRVSGEKTIIAYFLPDAGEFTSEDEMISIIIPEGATVLDEEGELITSLEFTVNETPPPPPEASIVGLSYDVEPDGTIFDQPVALTLSYNPVDIPSGVAEEDLVLAYYDENAGEWVELLSVVDPLNNNVTTYIEHLTTFAIIAFVPPAPAAFTLSSLSISPPEVDVGESASISVLVTNTGEEEGSYTVTLKIDDVVEETIEQTLAGGNSETVTFATVEDKAGTHLVNVNGLTDSFVVKEAPINWAILGPVIPVAVFFVIILPIRMWRRKYRFQRFDYSKWKP